MRITLLAALALGSAALAGLPTLRALAADPPSLEPASPAAPAPEASAPAKAVASKNSDAPKDASVGQRHPAPARAEGGAPRPPGKRAPAGRPLDLSAPPINHVMTREQVQAAIAEPDDAGLPENVTVEQGRYEKPVPRGQIQALAWALTHPLEAWRIFTPVTDE